MKDKIKFLDAVAVIEDLPELGLKRGEVGTVVDAWKDGAFEVEFSDKLGEAYAFVTLRAEKLMPLYYRHREAVSEQTGAKKTKATANFNLAAHTVSSEAEDK